MVLKFTHPGSSRPHHPSFPDFLIDFGAPPKNKSCHASFPSSIYMPKSGRKFSWIKPPDFRDSTFFWMSIKWMTNFPPLFCHNKKTQKEKALEMFRKFYLYPSIWDILDKVLDVVICSIDGYRKPRICSHFIGQSHHVFQTHSRMWTLSVVAGSYPLFLGVIRAIKELWKISVDLAHQKKTRQQKTWPPKLTTITTSIEVIQVGYHKVLIQKCCIKQIECSHSSAVPSLFACIQSINRRTVKFSRLAKKAGWKGDVR